VGSTITLVLLTVVAFVTFDSVGHVAAVAGTYIAIATIEGQVVQPLLVGHRLELNPVIVFLALWFGGWFWGIAGIIIAVPSLVALKVVSEHSKNGNPLVEVLSPNPTSRFNPAQVSTSLAFRRIRKKAAGNV
jgi:predicted PurR-regulated permease PerM